MNHTHIQVNTLGTWTINAGFLTSPVTLIKEGVHSGSDGAVYWPASVLRQFADSWNGIVVCLNHPHSGGRYVSINHDAQTKSTIVGTLTGVRFCPTHKAIVGNIKVNANHPQIALIQGLREVSIGVFCDKRTESGLWGDEYYSTVATSMQPDHLAILTKERGACSFDDGCGIRNNALINNQTIKAMNEVQPLLPPGMQPTAPQQQKPSTTTVKPMLPNTK